MKLRREPKPRPRAASPAPPANEVPRAETPPPIPIPIPGCAPDVPWKRQHGVSTVTHPYRHALGPEPSPRFLGDGASGERDQLSCQVSGSHEGRAVLAPISQMRKLRVQGNLVARKWGSWTHSIHRVLGVKSDLILQLCWIRDLGEPLKGESEF